MLYCRVWIYPNHIISTCDMATTTQCSDEQVAICDHPYGNQGKENSLHQGFTTRLYPKG